MNLFEQIHKGIELVEKGKALGKETGPVEDKVKALQGRLNKEIEERHKKQETALSAECLPGIKLSEFARRDIAVEIYSEVLGCNLWLCSNNKMAAQIKQDAPEQVCYTAEELRHLISLNPGSEDVKRLHEAKSVFRGSRIVDSKLKDELPEVLK